MREEPQARDTTLEVDRLLIRAYREMSPAEKVRRISELCRSTSELALAGIRMRHPGCSEREALLRLASLRIAPETMRRAFGWDPEQHGY